jgi:hypothetical protein
LKVLGSQNKGLNEYHSETNWFYDSKGIFCDNEKVI